MHPADFTNDPAIAGRNDDLVSINGTLQVDLLGQCGSESLGSLPYSGTGGQSDFVRAANRSRGGKSFIVLPSTARDGTVSRIVATLASGTHVSTSKNDVNYVVTEHGVAQLLQMAAELHPVLDLLAQPVADRCQFLLQQRADQLSAKRDQLFVDRKLACMAAFQEPTHFASQRRLGRLHGLSLFRRERLGRLGRVCRIACSEDHSVPPGNRRGRQCLADGAGADDVVANVEVGLERRLLHWRYA